MAVSVSSDGGKVLKVPMIFWRILIGCQCFIRWRESSESANDIVVDSDWLSVFHQRGESSESANDIVVDSDWLSVFHQMEGKF